MCVHGNKSFRKFSTPAARFAAQHAAASITHTLAHKQRAVSTAQKPITTPPGHLRTARNVRRPVSICGVGVRRVHVCHSTFTRRCLGGVARAHTLRAARPTVRQRSSNDAEIGAGELIVERRAQARMRTLRDALCERDLFGT